MHEIEHVARSEAQPPATKFQIDFAQFPSSSNRETPACLPGLDLCSSDEINKPETAPKSWGGNLFRDLSSKTNHMLNTAEDKIHALTANMRREVTQTPGERGIDPLTGMDLPPDAETIKPGEPAPGSWIGKLEQKIHSFVTHTTSDTKLGEPLKVKGALVENGHSGPAAATDLLMP
jgi:hypothetical protein